MIKLKINKQWINFTTLEWSGTDTQASRQVTFSIPHHPFDKTFDAVSIKLGDLVYLYNDKKLLYIGTITTREKTGEVGETSYTSMDFMVHLLRSSGTYKFKEKTPEGIVKKVCGDVKISVDNLAKTKTNIPKILFVDQPLYDIIVKAYRKARAKTKKNYMPVMSGKKLSVIEKGKSCGVTLNKEEDITAISYSDTTDNMVNLVKIYDDKHKNLGKVESKTNTSKYGIFQSTYTKEKGVNAKDEAKSMLVGITKEYSIEAIGNIKAVSGKTIKVKDGLYNGTFHITSDTHTFSNGVHTMSLSLSRKSTSESGAKTTTEKPAVTNASKCYYIESGSVFHSSKSCSACKGTAKTTTVEQVKRIKNKNGKRKYKACSKCWRS